VDNKTRSWANHKGWIGLGLAILVTTSLAACGGPNPEQARDQALVAIENALRTGSGEEFCSSLNAVAPSSCTSVILDSTGLAEAELDDFQLSDTSWTHSIQVSGFTLELESTLFEFEDGPEYVFTIRNLQLPAVTLPYGGTLAGVALQAGQTSQFMPSDAPGELVASSPEHGFLVAQALTSPWVNAYPIELDWSPEAEELALDAVISACTKALEAEGYDTFARSSNMILSYNSEFKRAATYLTSFYADGTPRANKQARYINSPSGLKFEPCVAERVALEDNQIVVEWATSASFQGTIGLQTERDTIFDDYTGEYKDYVFSTTVAGVATISISTNSPEADVRITNINAGMPLEMKESN